MKKDKTRTPLPTRRRRALKYLAYAALAVLIVNYTMHIGLLLPVQAIREVEEREGAHGRIVKWLWEPAVYRTGLFCLTENENMVLLGSTHFSFLGWSPGFGWAVDCTGGAPLYAGETASYRDGRETIWHFYGRVDDPEIETVEISLRSITGYDEAEQKNLYEERVLLTSPREDWLEKEGRRFFLLRWRQEDWPEHSRICAFAVGRNAAGEVVTELDIEEGIHSYYG